MTRRIVVAVVVLLGLAGVAAAQPDAGAAVGEASAALSAGEHARAITLAAPVTQRGDASRADRAEAHRVLGLAHFFLGDFARAEAELLAYLRLDLDARLDPSQVPPEAVTFFEDVRSRHAAELRALRPRQRRYRMLNLLPPGGQIQNREPRKAWVIGGAELVLAATHLTTYLVLRSWCDEQGYACSRGDEDVPDMARKLRLVNYLSGAALIGVYVYGVVDGFRGAKKRRERPIVSAAPREGGFIVGVSLSF